MCEVKFYNGDGLVTTIKTVSVSEAVEKAASFIEECTGSTALILQDGAFYSVISSV